MAYLIFLAFVVTIGAWLFAAGVVLFAAGFACLVAFALASLPIAFISRWLELRFPHWWQWGLGWIGSSAVVFVLLVQMTSVDALLRSSLAEIVIVFAIASILPFV